MGKNREVEQNLDELMQSLQDFESLPDAIALDLKLDFSEIVIQSLRNKGWTQKQLADATGMKEAYISRIVHADQNCTLAVIGKICHALDIKPKLQVSLQMITNDQHAGESEYYGEKTRVSEAKSIYSKQGFVGQDDGKIYRRGST